MRVAIIGSDVPALVLALRLSSTHTVTVIEQEAEIGMPVHHPGRILDLNVLTTYIPKKHHGILQLHDNGGEFGCRWEWVVKLLTIECATHGVRFETRSRVTSMTEQSGIHRLEFNHLRKEMHIDVDVVIDMNIVQDVGPGRRTHCLNADGLLAWGKPELAQAKGILIPSNHLDLVSVSEPAFIIPRADHQTEIWWYGTSNETSTHGVLERMHGYLPLNGRLVSFDGCVILAERVLSGLEVEHI